MEMELMVSSIEKDLEEAKDRRKRFVHVNNDRMKDRKLFSKTVREMDDRIDRLEKALRSARKEREEVLRMSL